MNNDPRDPVTAAAVATECHTLADNDRKDPDVARGQATTVPASCETLLSCADTAGFLSDILLEGAASKPCARAPPASARGRCAGRDEDNNNDNGSDNDNSDLDMGRRRRCRRLHDENDRTSTWRHMASMAALALAISILAVVAMRPPPGHEATVPSDAKGHDAVGNATVLGACHCADGYKDAPTIEGRLTIAGSLATCTCTWPVQKATTPFAEIAASWAHDVFANLDGLVEPAKTALVLFALTVAAPLLSLHLVFGA
ncbi:hypothetical protein psal_cds_916 [Pandoravirus salinus]|uniref:Uncharacterized protein n=1 Tax=Pandoravirus salinus TaxID=1349410 RepID=S4VWL4_9VIRU|nr:hypothetical protein psal_cds_916 [Pandoravirus salinus]AGO85034.1 hypothetical protein psal_cds_916 [Pandoravirus salinus]